FGVPPHRARAPGTRVHIQMISAVTKAGKSFSTVISLYHTPAAGHNETPPAPVLRRGAPGIKGAPPQGRGSGGSPRPPEPARPAHSPPPRRRPGGPRPPAPFPAGSWAPWRRSGYLSLSWCRTSPAAAGGRPLCATGPPAGVRASPSRGAPAGGREETGRAPPRGARPP